tara:strand:+ start:874 stop:1056 length:183 start_codon:yes stop_codon:yes gene_type:complete
MIMYRSEVKPVEGSPPTFDREEVSLPGGKLRVGSIFGTAAKLVKKSILGTVKLNAILSEK